MMRNLIIVLAIMTVLAGTSLAAITNPDGFEGYTPGSWSPTVADGWTSTLSTATITATGGVGGSQGVNAGGGVAGGLSWTGSGNISGAIQPLQAFDFDFRVTTGQGTNTRWAVTTENGGSYGAFSLYASDYGSTIKLQAQNLIAGQPHDSDPANYQLVTTNLPGAGVPNAGTTWRDGNWHHITIEMDFANGDPDNGLMRARYDNNAWTAWVPMSDYRGWGDGRHSTVTFQNLDDYHPVDRDFNLDNVAWSIPEPATMVMLSLGALLLRRKR